MGISGLGISSINAEESAKKESPKQGVAAQPAAGPLTEFRIARRTLFGGKRDDKKSALQFRRPANATPNPAIPRPPADAPAIDDAPKVDAPTQPRLKQEPADARTAPRIAARPKSPIAHPTHSQQRTSQPSSTTAAPNQSATRVSDGGWVARQEINSGQPLRDPSTLKPNSFRPPNNVRTRQRSAATPSPQPRQQSKQQPKPQAAPQQRSVPIGQLGTERVPAAELAPARPAKSIETKPKKEANKSTTASSSIGTELELLPSEPDLKAPESEAPRSETPESADPDLTGPTLAAPQRNSPTDDTDTAEAAQESGSQQKVRPAPGFKAPAKSDDDGPRSDVKRPETVKVKAAPKPKTKSPEPEARVSSRHQEPPAASQYVGTEPPEITLDYTGYPTEGVQPNARVARMKPAMARVLQYFYDRPEIADGRSNWGIMHSIMVYGVDTRVMAGRKSYSAIGWIAGNNICRGKRLLTNGPNGIEATSGVGLQGHQAQFLAVLSLCDVPADYPLYAGNTKYSVRDLIKAEMAACKSGEELTFTLIGLAHYLDTDAVWTASDGQRWDVQRLIREELSQPIVGSACGGTHRLMGFAHALRKRRAEGRPITGQWARAKKFTDDFVRYAYQLQNRDGSMSTKWFEGRADDGKVDRKIQTTGHIVEWLLTVTPDSELQNPRLVAAVQFLLASLHNDLGHDWQIGPKGHALRSLAMYHDRVFQANSPWRKTGIARSASATYR